MLKRGIATIEAYSGRPWPSAPLVAQWVSLTDGWAGRFLRPFAADGDLRPQHLVYLESHLDAEGYDRVLLGDYDDRLRELRDSLAWAPSAIKRWDHEMDGPANAWRRWGKMDPDLYIAGWRHVSRILGPMFWCPTSLVDRAEPYYPGDEYVSHVGCDLYIRAGTAAAARPIEDVIGRRVRTLKKLAPSKRVLLGELGLEVGLPNRPFKLAQVDLVPDLWGACYFDVDRSDTPEKVDWRLGDAERRVWLP